MKTLKHIQNEYKHVYYKYTCKYCDEELIMNPDEWVTNSDNHTIEFKCCNCGHVNIVNSDDYREHHCDENGKNNIKFELNDVESNNIRKFIERHNHREEFKKLNKLNFSTLGMQFTYHITPGGLGPLIEIECNQCHEKKDVTNTENW